MPSQDTNLRSASAAVYAAKGKVFIIVKAGKPMVKVLPLSGEQPDTPQRLDFMSGEISVPDDFDSLGAKEIADLFKGKSL